MEKKLKEKEREQKCLRLIRGNKLRVRENRL